MPNLRQLLLLVEEASTLDIVNATLVATAAPLDCPRAFTVEALCPWQTAFEGFALLPANAALINLQALLSDLLRHGVGAIELVPTSPHRAFDLCSQLSTEKVSVRDKDRLPKTELNWTLPRRIQDALGIRKNLGLSNATEDLRINEYIHSGFRASSLAIAKAVGKDESFRADVSKLIRPSPWPGDPRLYLKTSSDEPHPAADFVARSKELLLASLSVSDPAAALVGQHDAALSFFKGVEIARKECVDDFWDSIDFSPLERLWMQGWYDTTAAGHALDHLSGLWVDSPSYRDQHYALLAVRIEDESRGSLPPFITYLPKAGEIAKLIGRVFDAEAFIDSRSRSVYNYLGHLPRNQAGNVFKFLEYSVDERHGKPLRDPPFERTVTDRPPWRPGPYYFVCSLRFPGRQKALDAIQGVHRGTAGAVENTILGLLNATFSAWNVNLELKSVQIMPFTGMGATNWPLAWGWPRFEHQARFGTT